MNRFLAFLSILLSLSGLLGCNDQLNLRDPNNVVEEIYYQTEAEALSGLAGVYDAYQSVNLMGKKYREFDHITDNATTVQNTGGWLDLETSAQAPTSTIINTVFWSAYYTVISRANSCIDRVSAMSSEKLSDPSRKQIIAEASFLRDYAHADLTALWGNIPLYTTPIKSYTPAAGSTSATEVRKWLIADLENNAIPHLAEKTSGQNGRIRKAAARALLGKLYAYEGEFAKAAASFKAIIDTRLYDLHPKYDELFSVKGEFSQESLFEINFTGGSVDVGESFSERVDTSAATIIPNQFWQPISSLVNSYLCTDGKPITQSAVYGSPSPLFNTKTPFVDRDPRLRASIYTNADVGNSGKAYWKFSNVESFAVKKYTSYSKEQFTNGGPQNYYVIRFAEVLLSYAEAQNEIAGPDASVYEAVNRIRARVGLPSYPQGLSVQEMRQRIRDERRWEFAFEHQRFFDLQRWGQTGSAVTTAMPAKKKYSSPKDLLWPYPQNEMDRNSALKTQGQNAGY